VSDRFFYAAKVLHVVDGDTVDLMIDLGFNIHHEIRVRLYGVDTPESRTTNVAEKAAGLKSKAFVTAWTANNPNVFIQTMKDKNEKYGRILANMYADEAKTECLNTRLVTEGFAKAYFGDKKEAFNAGVTA